MSADDDQARDRTNGGSGISRPVFIVSSPRSGSSLLFQTLVQAPETYSIGGESHELIEGIEGLHPQARSWSSNRLDERDATAEMATLLSRRFYERLRDRDGRRACGPVRMIEKTPKNSLRVPFFATIFPDAFFVYLYRDPRQTLHSMIEAWRVGSFRTYPALPGWTGLPWSLLLVPGWESLQARPVEEIAAHQWRITTRILIDDLSRLAPNRVRAISYDALIRDPSSQIARLCASVGLGWDRKLDARLPLSPTVVSVPRHDKWRRIEAQIEALCPIVSEADAQARDFLCAIEGTAGSAAQLDPSDAAC